ncbi:MAG: hypothetical protein QNJ20_18690 [Paracoccaceae bacterium]|nr:hypothetical protein [Paracoccaceae bacterium]
MNTDKIIPLCPREVVSLEPFAPEGVESSAPFAFAEDAVEDMVVCLAAIEASWAAGEFGRLSSSLKSVQALASKAGLPDVVNVAGQASELLGGYDEVALAAVVARLIRVGECSLATLLEISYRQI